MSAWINTDEQQPDDEQTVLACWLLHGGGASYASVTYHARDAEDGPESWLDWNDNTEDRPSYWMPLDALPAVPCTRQGNGNP